MRIRLVLAVGLVAVLSTRSSRGEGPPPTGIVWHDSYIEARELARSTGQPLLIEFR